MHRQIIADNWRIEICNIRTPLHSPAHRSSKAMYVPDLKLAWADPYMGDGVIAHRKQKWR